ncbi:ribosomal protein S12 methylthiotransferase [Elusimicrobium posterum]|uniref:30S ribosomal protein S12 methylthiotransferase RimO n=1 Tax=Elusimicrobium posterum TaxID=3116653 RepID=UPI003C7787D8
MFRFTTTTMNKIFTISLGCPKNLTDTEEMLGHLLKNKQQLVFDEAEADTVLLNTCAFIEPARKEAKYEIKRLSALKKKGKIKQIIVAGCLPQKEGAALTKQYPLVDAFITLADIDKINSYIKKPKHSFCSAPDIINSPLYKLQLTAPHSAYLKVADGCNNCCAYCTIPSIRGPYRSKPIEQVVEEAKALAANGAKEISLIAQDTTAYGKDLYGKSELVKLLKELVKIKGIKWLRIMYAYPETVTEELLNFIAKNKKMCRYLDMPLQHISEPVLKAMNRRSGEKEIKEKIKMIRRIVPDMALRTNFIAGFPGETEEDFKTLLNFVKKTAFDNVGVFAYSKEAGTTAAKMKNQIPQEIKEQRVSALISAQSRTLDKLNKSLIGKVVEVLMDTPAIARGASDAPDIDGSITVTSKKPLKSGSFVKVKIVSAHGYQRLAEKL